MNLSMNKSLFYHVNERKQTLNPRISIMGFLIVEDIHSGLLNRTCCSGQFSQNYMNQLTQDRA